MTRKHNFQHSYARIILKKGREVSLLRFHPWIFSGAIFSGSGDLADGDIVEVYSNNNEFLGTGHFEKTSLAVKIFSFVPAEVNTGFWIRKISEAYHLRQSLGLTGNSSTNAYRLVFTEGDAMPGLIIDYYNGVAVLQAQSPGMYLARQQIAEAVANVYQGKLTAVYDKSPAAFFESFHDCSIRERFLFGHAESPIEIMEHGHKFLIDFVKGQKTGFFIDQRENRFLLKNYAVGRKVLNLFSYSGGFSVYALCAGAKEVISVDSAPSAIALCHANVSANGFDEGKHHSMTTDVKQFVTQMQNDFDLAILDPPAFAKHKESKHSAMQGYKFLNTEVLRRMSKGGILFTFSCSQVVGTGLFESVVMAAAIEAKRNVRILHRVSQPPDHPVSIFHPEGHYLKGLVLYIE